MTLDRDAARALFDNAPPTPATAGRAPFVAASPFASAGDEAAGDRMSRRAARRGPDWRIIAPVGVAALCAGVALVIASQRDPAEPGRTVAAAEITPRPVPAPAPMTPAPLKMAQAASPASSIVEPPARTPAPVVRTRVRSEPARRAPAPRVAAAAAPNAADASADVSAHEPYVPPPVLGAPAQVTVTPVAPPPVVTPEPAPVTSPQP